MTEPQYIITDLSVYHSIAKDALAQSEQVSVANRRPKPDGSAGFIITFDPEQTSFKKSLIALVFAGIYFEALLWLEGCRRMGEDKYRAIDKKKYEERLPELGISDPQLVASAKRFREARKDLVHEKATVKPETLYWAQDEARHAVEFVNQITAVIRGTDGRKSEGG